MKTRKRVKKSKKTNQRGGLFGFNLVPEPVSPVSEPYGWSCQDKKMTNYGKTRRYKTEQEMNANINNMTWCHTLTPEAIAEAERASVKAEELIAANATNATKAANAANAANAKRNTASSLLHNYSLPINKEYNKLQKIFLRMNLYLKEHKILNQDGTLNPEVHDQHNMVGKFIDISNKLTELEKSLPSK
jgi:hypothetical protein